MQSQGKQLGELYAKHARCVDLSDAYVKGEPGTRSEASLEIRFQQTKGTFDPRNESSCSGWIEWYDDDVSLWLEEILSDESTQLDEYEIICASLEIRNSLQI